MTSYKISNKYKTPEGYTVAKKYKTYPESARETYPLTRMIPGDSFFVPNFTARDLRGVIHSRSRTRGMKFVSETVNTNKQFGARVWRIK